MKARSLILILLVAAGCSRQTGSPTPVKVGAYDYVHRLQIGLQTLNAAIANTPAERQQGLSGRKTMAADEGMLFEFGSPQTPGFWMKDMNFNLDLIWINQNKIIGITPDVPAPELGTPDNRLKNYYPPAPIDEVLEVNAGWDASNKIKTGDIVRLEN